MENHHSQNRKRNSLFCLFWNTKSLQHWETTLPSPFAWKGLLTRRNSKSIFSILLNVIFDQHLSLICKFKARYNNYLGTNLLHTILHRFFIYPEKSYWRGRLSIVHLLVLTSLDEFLLILKMLFTFDTKWATLMRRSIVLSLPLR
jgi:hypothetical protein